MTLEEYLIGENQTVEASYTCPISGKTGPAFTFAWTADDERFEHDYVGSEAYLSLLRDEAQAAANTILNGPPTWAADDERANTVRAKRSLLLSGCDWTQTLDCPLDETTKTAWATYRTALRDLPETYSDPSLVEWPTPPN